MQLLHLLYKVNFITRFRRNERTANTYRKILVFEYKLLNKPKENPETIVFVLANFVQKKKIISSLT